ncbi:MAG: phosphoribosylamine--glycine ligase, partial [Pseudomonadota bacterium]
MRILILGGGGREHALAWAVAKSRDCTALFCAPGNAGIAEVAECVSLPIEDGAAVVAWAREARIEFVIVGPEAPLVAGVADALRAAGIATFGPSAAAAQLEASKSFTHEIAAACGAPMAAHAVFDDPEAALAHLATLAAPPVVKAGGLAAGKGVVVAET